MNFSGRKFLLSVVLALLAGSGIVSANPMLSVGSTAGVSGSTVQVAINYTTDTNAPSLQFDLVYSTNYLSSGEPVAGNALSDHLIGSSESSPGLRRVLIFSFSNAPITNGVLVFVPFTIATNAPDQDEPLVLTNVVVASADAQVVPASATNGTLAIAVLPPQFSSIAPTNGGVIHLQLAVTAGRSYSIQATTNLQSPQWTTLETGVVTNGVLEFDDVSAGTFSRRFYRALVVP
jgi:Cohesin domain